VKNDFSHFTLFGKKRRGKLFSGENDFHPYQTHPKLIFLSVFWVEPYFGHVMRCMVKYNVEET